MMALFNKLFNKRKINKTTSSQTSSSQFSFNKEQVRILLFRECDWRGRRLLFDSSAIEVVSTPIPTTQNPVNNANTNSKPSLLKLDKNNVEYYEGTPYKVHTYNYPVLWLQDTTLIEYTRPNPDFKNVGEMVFGSVAISFRGTSFKVHWLHSPAQTLCSQVFLAPVQAFSSASSSSTNTHSSSGHTHASSSNYNGSDMMSEISGSISETNSLNSFSISENISLRTNPLDVPTALSLDNDDFKFISQSMGESSGYNSSDIWCGASNIHKHPFSSARSSLASIYSDVENHSRKMSISSTVSEYPNDMRNPSCDFGHFNRRIMKNLSTSFENVSTITENMSMIAENNYYTICGSSNLTGLSDGCVTKLRRNSEVVDTRRKTTSGDALSSNSSTLHHRSKRPRLAVAICIDMSECMENEMFIFCSEHMALLEQMVYRLRAAAENAYINRTHFLQLMIKCWYTTSQWLVDLFSAPRLVNPVWLSLSTTSVKHSNQLAHSFIQDLCSLLNSADTKDTNFFISTLLTAVLTHHLGWIGTVAPLMTSTVRENFNKNGTNPMINKLIEEENMKLSEISKIFPYNALWAQLGDLYGAITCPIKLSKTIICGSDANVKIIDKLLNIMTYFIRCSEIKRNAHTKIFDKDELNKSVNQQLNRPPMKSFQIFKNSSSNVSTKNGLTRSSTTMKDLSLIAFQDQDEKINENFSNEDLDPETYRLLVKILKKKVMNDIPKVLAFRDSRFVKQELRIGNKSMDTDIEMPSKDREFILNHYHVLKPEGNNISGDHIKLTVTRPDSIEEAIELDDENELQNFISLSSLITENSLGGAQNIMKMFFERDQFKENSLSLEQIKHLERLSAEHQERMEQRKIKGDKSIQGNTNVVFVLGDDEKLVGLKSSASVQTLCEEPSTSSSSLLIDANKKVCRHSRKHSGVKFNFEKYPQIATNYMKSKNLEFSELEVLEKGLKLDRSNFASSLTLNSQTDSESDDECKCSQYDNGLHYLQTPSNATELEFTSDNNYLTPSSSNRANTDSPFSYLQTLDENKELKPLTSNAADETKIVEIRMLDSIKSQSVQDEILKPGFTSSLFTSTSDHYIADMILQGVTALPSKWEAQLKQDLSISSYCGVLEQSQAENIAIVANIDKWDVRLISSHSNVLPSHNNTANGMIGMSQLVASMLECVQAMFNSGVPEFQCLSFIESKLREMYLHSETLAAFLMETEFCSLNMLTTTLNLSVNDIPLLMSIASIHSPQVAKKYGISYLR